MTKYQNAYDMGVEAFLDGKQEHDCPFGHEEPVAREEWIEGFYTESDNQNCADNDLYASREEQHGRYIDSGPNNWDDDYYQEGDY